MDPTQQQIGDQQILAASLALVKDRGDEMIGAFYEQLFAEHEELRAMFASTDMPAQRQLLLGAVVALASHYHEPDRLLPALTKWGVKHAKYGVNVVHYAWVGQALLATFAAFAGAAFTAQVQGSWLRAYQWAAGHMMAAGAVAAEQG